MDDRLSKMIFAAPRIDRKWDYDAGPEALAGSGATDSPTQLFYSDPPWYRLCPSTADHLARSIADHGVAVTGLLRDLSGPRHTSRFHQQPSQHRPRLRIVPYRCERYGLIPEDFDAAKFIELRLTLLRDPDGRYAYLSDQVSRWEPKAALRPDSETATSDHRGVPAASFPPDVESLDQLSIKIRQLQTLSGGAAVLVAMTPYRLQEELPPILSQNPDGILLRCTEQHFPAFHIAKATRQIASTIGDRSLALWVDAPGISPTDAVKLAHLGATGVCIDRWCDPIIDYAVKEMKLGTDVNSMSDQLRTVSESRIDRVVEHMLTPFLEEFRGHGESISGLPRSSRFVATDPAWADALGLEMLE